MGKNSLGFREGNYREWERIGIIPSIVKKSKKMRWATIEEVCEICRLREYSVRLWCGIGILTKEREFNQNYWRDNKRREKLGLPKDVKRTEEYVVLDLYFDCLLRYLGFVGGLLWFARKLREYRKEKWRMMWAEDIQRKREWMKGIISKKIEKDGGEIEEVY